MAIEPRTLDVRPILIAGGEPFGAIMEAVAGLKPQQALRLLATFKPVPLFAVMEGKGYRHDERPLEDGDWEVLFSPTDAGDGATKELRP